MNGPGAGRSRPYTRRQFWAANHTKSEGAARAPGAARGGGAVTWREAKRPARLGAGCTGTTLGRRRALRGESRPCESDCAIPGQVGAHRARWCRVRSALFALREEVRNWAFAPVPLLVYKEPSCEAWSAGAHPPSASQPAGQAPDLEPPAPRVREEASWLEGSRWCRATPPACAAGYSIGRGGADSREAPAHLVRRMSAAWLGKSAADPARRGPLRSPRARCPARLTGSAPDLVWGTDRAVPLHLGHQLSGLFRDSRKKSWPVTLESLGTAGADGVGAGRPRTTPRRS